jgi:single-stranded DNA-binding protein
MYNNNPQSGYPQGGYSQNGNRPMRQKKEKINQWEGIGIVSARSQNQNQQEPIRFFQFTGGGGAIHFNLKCIEYTGTMDANNQMRMRTTYIPVSVFTNKIITAQQLMNITPGMKVHIVGKLDIENYENKTTGQKKVSLIVNAYVFEILEMPMQQAYGAPQPYAVPQQQYPQPQQAYAPQAQPPQYGAPQYAPQQPQAPAYYQQPQQAQHPQGAQQPQRVPPYYQQASQPQAQAPQQPFPPMPAQAKMPVTPQPQGAQPQQRYAPQPQTPKPQATPAPTPDITDIEDMPEL